MEEFEYYLKEEEKIIRKVVIINKSNETKLFKISNSKEVVKLLLIEKNQKKEIEIDDLISDILVTKVSD